VGVFYEKRYIYPIGAGLELIQKDNFVLE